MSVRIALGAVVIFATLGCENDIVIPAGEGSDTVPGRVTLVATDPLRSTYNFESRAFASILNGGKIVTLGAHLDFGGIAPDSLTAGTGTDGSPGYLLDLGTDADVAGRIGATVTTSGGDGFFGLSFSGSAFNDPDANALFSPTDDARRPLAAKVEHVYVLRIGNLVVKLLIVEHHPEADVTFRWARLR